MTANKKATVTQWTTLDLTFEATGTPAWNAFPLQVTFENGGTRLTVDGYWAGARAWRVRFAPASQGAWTWQTQSEDAGLSGKRGSFTCEPPTREQVAGNPNLRGHLKPSEDGHYFVYADGTPFLYLGDTCWHMNERRCGLGANEDGPFFVWLADRKEKGFTVINHWLYASGHPKRNQEIISENEGGPAWGADKEGRHDFAALNPSYYDYVDRRWQALWANGFVMAGPPTWFCKPDHHMSLAQAQDFSRYVMARYGAFNMVWALSGEQSFGPTWCQEPWDRTETWNALGAFMAEHNPYGHPLSIHPGPANTHVSSSELFGESRWLDHHWLQTGQYPKGLYRVAERARADYDRTPARPVLQAEGFYEGSAENTANPAQARFQPWVALLNGACGAVYGACGIWPFADPADPKSYSYKDNLDWRAALALPGAASLRHLVDFMWRCDWWRFVPQRENLLVGDAPAAMPTAEDYTPPHCAGVPGRNLVVYVPAGNAETAISLNALPADACIAKWFDPREGTYAELGAVSTDENGRWTLPARPEPAGDDWVCLVEACG